MALSCRPCFCRRSLSPAARLTTAAIRPPTCSQGGNQAAAAARLGCYTRLVAQVGQDAQASM